MHKNKRKILIQIDIEAGSDFQYECIQELMMTTIATLAGCFESRHKSNKFRVEIRNEK